MRARIASIGVEAARAVGYRGAGTVEGLLADGEYYFLEMNTRVQVEHSVTEMATGIDIVREQILIAAGEPLSFAQEDVELRGHAIECRINAEDASKNFAPAPGPIGRYREPAGPFVRVDSGVEAGAAVLPYYDPMIAKLIVWDRDREAATRRMLRALDEYEIEGLKTLLPFHRALLQTEQWAGGSTCRDLIGDRAWLKGLAPLPSGLTRQHLPRRVSQARRGRPDARRVVAQFDRRAELRRAVQVDDHAAVPELRVVDRLAEVVYGPHAGVAAVEDRQPFVAGLREKELAPGLSGLRVECVGIRSGRSTPSHSSLQNGGSSAPTVMERPSAHS